MREPIGSRRTWLVLGALVGSLALPTAPVCAQLQPSIADQPAATLLLPYFEVDLANPAGANTIFSVNNSSATAVLAHVTLWSTMHVPVYAFNVYLTGYDAQPLNVRDILSGVLPQTASAGQDPTDTISPHGLFSQDINFASCNTILPPAALPQATIDHVRNALTGQASAVAGGLCASISDGTRVARGYITVDTVNNCTSRLPNEAGYFGAGGTGDATNQNVLWGDYTYTNHIGGFESSDGSPLVHIRANAADAQLNTAGQYTFYGRLVAWTAVDNREPLATSFAVRYVSAGAAIGTTLTVWRDAKVNQSYFSCSSRPSWYPLGQEQVVAFDEQEHVASLSTGTVPFSPQPPAATVIPFPVGAQRVTVGGANLPTIYPFGWLYLNLNTTVAGSPNPSEDPAAAQAWVSSHQKGVGRYSSGWAATMYDTAKTATHVFFPVP